MTFSSRERDGSLHFARTTRGNFVRTCLKRTNCIFVVLSPKTFIASRTSQASHCALMHFDQLHSAIRPLHFTPLRTKQIPASHKLDSCLAVLPNSPRSHELSSIVSMCPVQIGKSASKPSHNASRARPANNHTSTKSRHGRLTRNCAQTRMIALMCANVRWEKKRMGARGAGDVSFCVWSPDSLLTFGVSHRSKEMNGQILVKSVSQTATPSRTNCDERQQT